MSLGTGMDKDVQNTCNTFYFYCFKTVWQKNVHETYLGLYSPSVLKIFCLNTSILWI